MIDGRPETETTTNLTELAQPQAVEQAQKKPPADQESGSSDLVEGVFDVAEAIFSIFE
jgi:hypothetical protein